MMDHELVLLEIGNTTVKVARVGGDAPVSPESAINIDRYDVEDALDLLTGEDAEIICLPIGVEQSVQLLGHLHDRVRLRLLEREDVKAFVADSYDTPETLGLDRILNLMGLGGDGIVISCGTAITVDAVADGRPFWGAIMPGFRTAAQGLHDRIPVLPLVAIDDADSAHGLPARTSVASVANGILLGTAGGAAGLAGMLAATAFAGSIPRVVLTGGDGRLLLQLWSGNPTPALDDALLFRGMLRALEKSLEKSKVKSQI